MNKVLALLGALVLAVIAYTALSPQSANDESAAALRMYDRRTASCQVPMPRS